MALISVAAEAPPAFISENYVNRFSLAAGDLVASKGQEIIHRIYDMVPESIWATAGSNDATQETITGGFYAESAQVNRDIDFMAFLGHNLKDFTIKLSNNNGSTYPNTYAYAGVSASNTIRSLAATVEANKWQIVMDTVQSGDEKQIGVVVFGKLLFQAVVGFSKPLSPEFRQLVKRASMADGSKRYARIFRADTGSIFRRYPAAFPPMLLSEANKFLTNLVEAIDPFIFYPEPGNVIGRLILAQVVPNTFKMPYVSLHRGAGYLVMLEIEDVGGA